MLRIGNPNVKRLIRRTERGVYSSGEVSPVTWKGITTKSIVMGLVTMLSALACVVFVKNAITSSPEAVILLLLLLGLSAIPMLILSLIIFFKPETAKVLGIIYCLFNGLFVGSLAGMAEVAVPGIALIALLGTTVVFLVTVIIYRLIGHKITNKFGKFVLISLISLIVLQLGAGLVAVFSNSFAQFLSSWTVQFAISGLSILWATFVLLLDFHNMNTLVQYQVDKKYEWISAFSLITTLVWLYVEILELLLKIVARARGNN